MNFKEKLPQNAGNRISEVLDFKISRGSIPPDPPTCARFRFSASVNKTSGSAPAIQHYTTLYKTIHRYTKLYSTIYKAIQQYIKLYNTYYVMLYKTIQHYVRLYDIKRHYATLYNSIQDYITL